MSASTHSTSTYWLETRKISLRQHCSVHELCEATEAPSENRTDLRVCYPDKVRASISPRTVYSILNKHFSSMNKAQRLRGFVCITGKLTKRNLIDILNATCSIAGSVRKDAGGIHESVKRLAYTLRKEVKLMPITLTFHLFGFTVTVRIKTKSNNRHSAK